LKAVYDPWRIRVPAPEPQDPEAGYEFEAMGFEPDVHEDLGDNDSYSDIVPIAPGPNLASWYTPWQP